MNDLRRGKSKKRTKARKGGVRRSTATGRSIDTTFGDLVVAAFDAVGNEVKAATALLTSLASSGHARQRIVFV